MMQDKSGLPYPTTPQDTYHFIIEVNHLVKIPFVVVALEFFIF